MYEVVVTNWYGLRFGDVIKLVGYTENTPSYTFEYRKTVYKLLKQLQQKNTLNIL